jgi:general secretion pathway protein G
MKSWKQIVTRVAAHEEGLTLIEIMIVIAILGMLAAIIGVNVLARFEEAKVQTTQSQIKDLESALKLYYRDCSKYPSTAEGLQSLVTKPASCPRWKKYLDAESVPRDAWDNQYEYFNPGTHGHEMEIISKGKDAELNTADDVVNWDASAATGGAGAGKP